nr:hypothetical protein [Tanacetum cinerariifolium]
LHGLIDSRVAAAIGTRYLGPRFSGCGTGLRRAFSVNDRAADANAGPAAMQWSFYSAKHDEVKRVHIGLLLTLLLGIVFLFGQVHSWGDLVAGRTFFGGADANPSESTSTPIYVDAPRTGTWDGGNEPFKASYGKLMMWFFLLSDAFTFGAFLTAYGMIRHKHGVFVGTADKFFFSTAHWPIPEKVFNGFPGLHGMDLPLAFVALM